MKYCIAITLLFLLFSCGNTEVQSKTPISSTETQTDTFDNGANTQLIQKFIDKKIFNCTPDYYKVIFSTINDAGDEEEKDFRHTQFHRIKQCDDGIKSSYISVLYNLNEVGDINSYASFHYDGENDFEYVAKYPPSYYCFSNYSDSTGSSQLCLFDAQNDRFMVSDSIYEGEILLESSLDFDAMQFEVSSSSKTNPVKRFRELK